MSTSTPADPAPDPPPEAPENLEIPAIRLQSQSQPQPEPDLSVVLDAIAGRGDIARAITVVEALPRGERRSRLAADLLAAQIRRDAFQFPVGDESGRANRLLAVAEEVPPHGVRWRPTRASFRAAILMREALETRLTDPVRALEEVDDLEIDAAGEPGALAMIRTARTVLTILRGMRDGDLSIFSSLRGDVERFRNLVPGHPELEKIADFMDATFDAVAAHQHGAEPAEVLARFQAVAAGLDRDDPLRVSLEETNLLAEGVVGPGNGVPQSREEIRAKLAELAEKTGFPDLNDDQRAFYRSAAGATALRASRDHPDVDLVDEGIGHFRAALDRTPPGHPQLTHRQLGLALAFVRRNDLTADLADLRAAAEILEDAREAAQGPQDPLWLLINQTLGQIGARLGDDKARDAALDGMRNLAWKVLLQSDTASARAAARDGAEFAIDTALNSLAAGDPGAAARALDSGRALMLFSAAEFRDIGPRLDRAGHEDLAERWRRSQRSGGQDRMPTSLRRDVLGVLADGSGLLDPPTPADIQAALRRLDADALVYLVPGDGQNFGLAVMVPAHGPAAHLVLPDLSIGEDHDAARHLDVIAGRDMAVAGRPRSRARSLEALCRWAWDVAIGPIIERYLPGLPEPAGRPRRLVLVPSGRLALVPWHAACGSDGVFAVERAAFSLTASARMLCRVAAAPPVPLTPVGLIVGDPVTRDPVTGDPVDRLAAARVEAYAVHQAFYRGGRYLGTRADGSPSRAGAGTGEEVRTWLTAAGPTAGPVLHLACHGVIETDGADGAEPTSYLLLADGDRITADEIVSLMASAPEREVALAVLAACHTAESVHGYDEAYSLGTALLAGGVRSVLSTQWAVPDEATSVLMFMVHHYLMAEGLPVWAALRRAQLWMLGPERPVPSTMPGALRRRLDQSDLTRIEGWAGFVHQGR